jgi:predicted phage terminase large subunit-like protein
VNTRVLGLVRDRLGEEQNKKKLTLATPGALAKYVDARTVQTPALDIIDAALVDAVNGVSPWLIITCAPQEGKTSRVSRTFPAWLLQRNPHLRIAVVSYAQDLALTSAKLVRNDIESNPDLGIAVRRDTRAGGEWRLEGFDGGMIAAGIGSGLAGRPVDVLLIDDPLKDRQEADSEKYRKRCWDWWTEVGSARLGPGAIVVVIMTRWHEADLVGRLVEDAPGKWRFINIPAEAEHDPAKGAECKCAGKDGCLGFDILGRQPGEFMVSARGRTHDEWVDRKKTAGPRAWNALYQGRPSPDGGGIFERDWWQYYDTPRAVQRDDGTMFVPGAVTIEIHVDAAFKDTKDSDFVVMQAWASNGVNAWLLDQVRDRMDFTVTCTKLEQLAAKWPQARAKVIEDKANGPAIISQLRKKVPGVIAYTPKDSKEARASAIAVYVEAGNVVLPAAALAPWVGAFVEETASFPNGANDDQVDAMSQALHRLLAKGRPQIRST